MRQNLFYSKESTPLQDIWKHEKLPKWLLLLLDQNSFQELVFKLFKNGIHRGSAPVAQFKWPKFVSLQTEATHFETMTRTVNEVNNNITKMSDKFIFRSVSVFCKLANSMCKLIHIRSRLIIKLM